MDKKSALMSFLLRGKRRLKIILELEKSPRTSIELSKILNISTSNIAKNLTEFKQKGLVEVLNPQDRSFKFYALSKKAREAMPKLKNILKTIKKS